MVTFSSQFPPPSTRSPTLLLSHTTFNIHQPNRLIMYITFRNVKCDIYRSSSLVASVLSTSIPSSLNAKISSSKSTEPIINNYKQFVSSRSHSYSIPTTDKMCVHNMVDSLNQLTVIVTIQMRELKLQIFLVLAHIVHELVQCNVTTFIAIGLLEELLRVATSSPVSRKDQKN